jgi:hypothetical protein
MAFADLMKKMWCEGQKETPHLVLLDIALALAALPAGVPSGSLLNPENEFSVQHRCLELHP